VGLLPFILSDLQVRDMERIRRPGGLGNATVYERCSSPHPSPSDHKSGLQGSSEGLETFTTSSSSSSSSGDQLWSCGSSRGQQAMDRLRFESRFESGNLLKAVHVWEHEYDLFLSQDINDR
jgi:hypothetical protein